VNGSVTEHWVEVNMSAPLEKQDGILLDVLRPHVLGLRRRGVLVSYHYFREPEIRFRVRLRTARSKGSEERALAKIADSLVKKGLVDEWHFGNHGEKGKAYVGEEDRYGKNGWKVAQDYFNQGAETALRLIALKRRGRLESPLWAKGKGNPWEGGSGNPWKERQGDPLVYHWSRHLHLFTNQLGFDIDKEVRLSEKQAERYRFISEELGMKW